MVRATRVRKVTRVFAGSVYFWVTVVHALAAPFRRNVGKPVSGSEQGPCTFVFTCCIGAVACDDGRVRSGAVCERAGCLDEHSWDYTWGICKHFVHIDVFE